MQSLNHKDLFSIGLITARGGSKGIARKNVRVLGDKPLIVWTIEAALASNLDAVIVSTDDEEIAHVSKLAGAEVPFLRPPELSSDTANHKDVIRHALEHLSVQKMVPTYITLLQPTSPFRSKDDINRCLCLAIKHNPTSVISITEAQKHPLLMREINSNRLTPLSYLNPLNITYPRRQDLPDAYEINGAIYVINTNIFLATNSWEDENVIPYAMPQERSIDIDNMFDLRIAQSLLQHDTI